MWFTWKVILEKLRKLLETRNKSISRHTKLNSPFYHCKFFAILAQFTLNIIMLILSFAVTRKRNKQTHRLYACKQIEVFTLWLWLLLCLFVILFGYNNDSSHLLVRNIIKTDGYMEDMCVCVYTYASRIWKTLIMLWYLSNISIYIYMYAHIFPFAHYTA